LLTIYKNKFEPAEKRLDDEEDTESAAGAGQLSTVPKSQRAKLRRRWWRTGRCSSSAGQSAPDVPVIILDTLEGQSSEDRGDDDDGRLHLFRQSSPFHFRRSICYGQPHAGQDGWWVWADLHAAPARTC
jgi:hypothetical protein